MVVVLREGLCGTDASRRHEGPLQGGLIGRAGADVVGGEHVTESAAGDRTSIGVHEAGAVHLAEDRGDAAGVGDVLDIELLRRRRHLADAGHPA